MSEKAQTIAELEVGLAAADEDDQPRWAAALAYVQTLPEDSPELVLYRADGRALWVPPVPYAPDSEEP